MMLHLDVLPKYLETIFAPGKQLAEAARQAKAICALTSLAEPIYPRTI
jgi:hypothetical protein